MSTRLLIIFADSLYINNTCEIAVFFDFVRTLLITFSLVVLRYFLHSVCQYDVDAFAFTSIKIQFLLRFCTDFPAAFKFTSPTIMT
jgi:hypothetical protein